MAAAAAAASLEAGRQVDALVGGWPAAAAAEAAEEQVTALCPEARRDVRLEAAAAAWARRAASLATIEARRASHPADPAADAGANADAYGSTDAAVSLRRVDGAGGDGRAPSLGSVCSDLGLVVTKAVGRCVPCEQGARRS